jgi:aldehyde oxidoreductase
MRFKIGADAEGRLTAWVADVIGDAGAYTELSAVLCKYSMVQASGFYRCKNVKVDMRMILTHNPTGTAMRGVGSPQITFAIEGAMDMLATKLGMDPLEFRKKNYLSKGESLATGQPLKRQVRLEDTAKGAFEALDKSLSSKDAIPPEKNGSRFFRGRGFASNMTGYGRHGTVADAYIALQLDGSARKFWGFLLSASRSTSRTRRRHRWLV